MDKYLYNPPTPAVFAFILTGLALIGVAFQIARAFNGKAATLQWLAIMTTTAVPAVLCLRVADAFDFEVNNHDFSTALPRTPISALVVTGACVAVLLAMFAVLAFTDGNAPYGTRTQFRRFRAFRRSLVFVSLLMVGACFVSLLQYRYFADGLALTVTILEYAAAVVFIAAAIGLTASQRSFNKNSLTASSTPQMHAVQP